MKISLASFITAMSLFGLAQAATVVKNYDEAQSLLTDDGYVLVLYPEDWNKKGKEAGLKYIKSETILKAAGNAVIIPVPRHQVSDDAVKEFRSKLLGKLPLPNVHSYPAFVLVDKKGRHYATIDGLFLRKGEEKKAAAELQKCLTSKREQDKLLAEAELTKDPLLKARKLGRAAEQPGINRPNNIQQMIKNVDPEDKSGYLRRLAYHPSAHAEGLVNNKEKTMEQKLAELEGMLEDSAYTAEQKQGIAATYIGMLRRTGDPAQMKRIPLIAEKMRSYAPDTVQAKSAPIVVRQWVRQLSLSDGWSPNALPRDNKPTPLEGPIPIKEPGTYEVTFTYTGGSQALLISAVELYDGSKKVAEDRHPGSTGHKHSNNVYVLKVSSRVTLPRLVVTFNQKMFDSHGNITVTKK